MGLSFLFGFCSFKTTSSSCVALADLEPHCVGQAGLGSLDSLAPAAALKLKAVPLVSAEDQELRVVEMRSHCPCV